MWTHERTVYNCDLEDLILNLQKQYCYLNVPELITVTCLISTNEKALFCGHVIDFDPSVSSLVKLNPNRITVELYRTLKFLVFDTNTLFGLHCTVENASFLNNIKYLLCYLYGCVQINTLFKLRTHRAVSSCNKLLKYSCLKINDILGVD